MIPASLARRGAPLALSLLLASAAAWGQGEAPKPAEPTPPTTPGTPAVPENPPVPALPPPVVRIPDRGDFKLVYEKTRNPDYLGLQQIFKETQLLQETVRALNDTLAMPTDVTAALRECGTADAPYDADKRRISICYELIDALSDLFTADVTSEEGIQQAGIAVAGATLFIFFHEAGHALIRLDSLPITGKEEDAVDQLATLLLLESGRQGEKAALDGATTFLAREKDAKSQAALARMPFWNAHALDQQRFANVICWVYGKNPVEFQYLVEDGTLPTDRAAQCTAEYEQMAKTWDGLLGPYLKGPGLVPPLPAPASPAPASPEKAAPTPPPPGIKIPGHLVGNLLSRDGGLRSPRDVGIGQITPQLAQGRSASRAASCYFAAFPFSSATHALMFFSSRSSGRAPLPSTWSWKARTSNLGPSSFSA